MDRHTLASLTIDMNSEKWRLVPVELVEVSAIKLLADGVPVDGLISASTDSAAKGEDPFPHLVSIQHTLWAEDGHCRILVWLIRGCGLMPMRVLRLE